MYLEGFRVKQSKNVRKSIASKRVEIRLQKLYYVTKSNSM